MEKTIEYTMETDCDIADIAKTLEGIRDLCRCADYVTNQNVFIYKPNESLMFDAIGKLSHYLAEELFAIEDQCKIVTRNAPQEMGA